MKITAHQLKRIIREELLREFAVAASGGQTQAKDGPLHQIDANGKLLADGDVVTGGLSAQFTVQGLDQREVDAMKKEYAVDSDNKYYFTIENRSSTAVSFHARNLGTLYGGRELEGKIQPGTGKSVGFYPIESTAIGAPDLSQQICVTPSPVKDVWGTCYKMNFGDVAAEAKNLVSGDDSYDAALIKLVIGAGKEPTAGSGKESGQAATKAETKKDAVIRLQKALGMPESEQDGVWGNDTSTAWKDAIDTYWTVDDTSRTGVNSTTIMSNWASAAAKLGFKPNASGAADFIEKFKKESEAPVNETVYRWNKLAGLLKS